MTRRLFTVNRATGPDHVLGMRWSIVHLAIGATLVGVPVSRAAFTTVGIQGTMSNFDVFNETGGDVYGAELELEGVHPNEVTKTFPSHFDSMSATEYTNGAIFGTRLVFTGYNFTPPNNFITPTTGHSTNGHYAVNLPGCEHFGFSVTTQPKATSFYWLNQASQTITAPLSIPMPTWSYVPAAGGAPAVMQAVLAPPPPPPFVPYPDAVWVKTFVTELPTAVDLLELISYDPDNLDPAQPSVSPQLPSEIEAEWELLPGDAPLAEPDIQLADSDQAVVRRYEYYQYTGSYDEVHLPNYQFTGGPLPPDAPLGQFIAANMVAANLVPEPGAVVLVLGALGASGCTRRRRRDAVGT